MTKKMSVIALLVLLIASCGSEVEKQETTQLTVSDITAKTADYVGQEVSITGTVEHVCRHGGKRMFMIGEDPKDRFKITPGPEVGTFDISLEGSDVRVVGVVQEQVIDEAYLDNWEAEVDAGAKPEVGHQGHDRSNIEEEDHDEESLRQIKQMRKRLAESGQESLSFYNLECQSLEILD
ncbi:MAG: hypothetical protein V2J62_07830 [candidate division KSB1 bacterium]|jgi:hypothetical protein|nr:hypothetical protein [candidate division KSB1 bacterium]